MKFEKKRPIMWSEFNGQNYKRVNTPRRPGRIPVTFFLVIFMFISLRDFTTWAYNSCGTFESKMVKNEWCYNTSFDTHPSIQSDAIPFPRWRWQVLVENCYWLALFEVPAPVLQGFFVFLAQFYFLGTSDPIILINIWCMFSKNCKHMALKKRDHRNLQNPADSEINDPTRSIRPTHQHYHHIGNALKVAGLPKEFRLRVRGYSCGVWKLGFR